MSDTRILKAPHGARAIPKAGQGSWAGGKGHVMRLGDGLALEGSYDALFAEKVRDWPMPRPRPEYGPGGSVRWLVDEGREPSLVQAMALLKFVKSAGWAWEPEAQAMVDAVLRRGETMRVASATVGAGIQVRGLGGKLFPYQGAAVAFALKQAGREVPLATVEPERGEKGVGILLADEMGGGKQQRIDAKVATPEGWRLIGSLRPGDFVTGSDGLPKRVLRVHPQGRKPSYRVTLSDGASAEAGPEHLWTVRYRCGGRRWLDLTLTTEQLRSRPIIEMKWPGRASTRLDLAKATLYLPMLSGPAQFTPVKLPVPPYLLGQLIANGCLGTPPSGQRSIRITSFCDDVPHVQMRLEREGVEPSRVATYGSATHMDFNKGEFRWLWDSIEELGLAVLSGRKHIPEVYLRGSPEERQALLHGLMDGDGSISPERNRVTYHTTSQRLADNVRELVESLGGIASVGEHDRSSEGKPTDYKVRIRLPTGITPFSLPRKAKRYRPGRLARPCRTIESVEYVEAVESVCITIDSKDHLYATEHFILTHNSVESLAILRAFDAFPALVTCEASLRDHWRVHIEGLGNDIPAWPGPGLRVKVLRKRADKIVPGEADVWVASYGWFQRSGGPLPPKEGLTPQEWREAQNRKRQRAEMERQDIVSMVRAAGVHGLLVDESQALRDPETLQTKAVLAAAEAVRERPGYVSVCLSGTPAPNGRAEEMMAQLEAVGWMPWFGGRGEYLRQFGGGKGASRLHMLLRSGPMLRRLKTDWMAELPPLERRVVMVSLGDAALSRLHDAEEEVVAWLKQKKEWRPGYMGPSAQAARMEAAQKMMKMMQAVSAEKVEAVTEWLKGWSRGEAAREKMVVFAHWRETQESLAREMQAAMGGAKVAQLEGGDPDGAAKAVQQFQTDEQVRLLVSSLKAGGKGHTLTKAWDIAFADLWFSPVAHTQAEGRAWARANDPHGLRAWYFVASGTVDETVWGVVRDKMGNIGALLDGTKETALMGEVVSLVAARMLAQRGVEA